MNQPVCVFIIKVQRNQMHSLSTWHSNYCSCLLDHYQEDNCDMFYINFTVLPFSSIPVSCLLTFLSSYVPRDYDVVNITLACSYHLWIYLNTYSLSHFIQYVHTCCHISVVYACLPECWRHGVLSREQCWKGTEAPSW